MNAFAASPNMSIVLFGREPRPVPTAMQKAALVNHDDLNSRLNEQRRGHGPVSPSAITLQCCPCGSFNIDVSRTTVKLSCRPHVEGAIVQ